MIPRIEVDGHAATAADLWFPAVVNYGHLTVIQVRGGGTRGLGLHLVRLDEATRELYGTGLDGDRVRGFIRHALGDDLRDASVRVSVFRPEPSREPSVMVVVRPPSDMPGTPQRLRSVAYQRPLAHVKHLGSFGQLHAGLTAERDGFDDALLTGPGGVVSEGAITNVGCYDGSGVTWPDAPALHGITMQLLERRLAAEGLPSRRAPVHLADLPSFATVFVCNSSGIAAVERVDDVALPVDAGFMKLVRRAYESVPWEPI
jgi:branched-subunit amino acid aminotransferase/4-amino-4-deoxychorismate lyase